MRRVLPLLLMAACSAESQLAPLAEDSSRQAVETPTCEGDRIDGKSEQALLGFIGDNPLETIYDVEHVLDQIATAFESCQDSRGLFATVYRPITQGAVDAIDEGAFSDELWARALVVDFAQRYVDALVDELEGTTPSWAWDRYYGLAADPGVSRTRIAVTGMFAHLILDLPHCLSDIGTRESHRDDYFVFGDLLVADSDLVAEALLQHHGVDAADLLGGFFWGDWIDDRFGSQATTSLSFQTLRLKAWNNAWFLNDWWGAWVADFEITMSFWTLDGILGTLDATGVI